MPSVIIPAHNESKVIGRCIDALLNDPDLPADTEVIVACNGCSDNSVEVASQRPVRVIDLATPSKVGAIRAAEAATTKFPRIYLDADVELAPGSLRSLSQALTSGDLLAAAPSLLMDTTEASLPVRWYHAVWSELPDIKHGLAGRGAYALSEPGRGRFGEFADVVADDLFIHSLFWPDEGHVVPNAQSTVKSSVTLSDLINRKRRVFRGNAEFSSQSPSPQGAHQGSRLSDLVGIARRSPRLIPAIPVYLAVGIVARRLARRDMRNGVSTWASDESSRT